ncbi:MAG: response regulator of the LytR/AlgR family [Bacillota bacterium]|jgi:DNA-binding LytR/AlgR family response regulator|nr:response regulator of the LytR/AlgR family [Bacillota bacterium]
MPVRIIVCDDDAEDIAFLSDALYTYDPSFEIAAFRSGETLLSEVTDSGLTADILFLDIYMTGMDGIFVAQRICAERKDLKIIFLSSSSDHYPQAYEVFAFNYLVKPLNRKKLYAVLDRALEELNRKSDYKISFHYKSASYNVNCRDILYVESRDKLLLFHLVDGSVLQTYWRLDELIKELPKQSFIRCHQSFLVNTLHITEMGENTFRLGQHMLSISRKYLKPAKERYFDYLFSHMGGGRQK